MQIGKKQLMLFLYKTLQIKQANTQEKNEATKDIIIGVASFLVFAPAKYTAAI